MKWLYLENFKKNCRDKIINKQKTMKKIIVRTTHTGEITYYLNVNGSQTTVKQIVVDFIPGVTLEDGDSFCYSNAINLK